MSSRVRFRQFIARRIYRLFLFLFFASYLTKIKINRTIVLFTFILLVPFLIAGISFISSFYCSLHALSWRVVFRLLFLRHIVYATSRIFGLSSAFLYTCPFIEVLSGSISRMMLSILQGEQSRCLSLWSDTCCRVWLPEVFSFALDTYFFFFSFISVCLMMPTSNIFKYW